MANRTKKSKRIKLSDLRGFKYFDQLLPLLERLHDIGTARDKSNNREFFFEQYVILLLLYFYNPVITSLRGLQQASEIDKVQKLLGVKRVSLGSMSESVSVFDPEMLREIVQELAQTVITKGGSQANKQQEKALAGLTAIDGTLLRALPAMTWAMWNDPQHRAAKMHLQFDILKGIPSDATITAAAHSEITEAQKMLQPGRFYVMDRGYGCYRLFQQILEQGSSFVIRVRSNTSFAEEKDLPLDNNARRAGVIRDMVIGKLGSPSNQGVVKQPIRLVIVEFDKENGEKSMLHLATDRLDLKAEDIAVAYRYRWSIELFFRWFKCILGCRHLLNQSQKGVTIQCYAGLIASLLITLWTGLKPTKRTWEMIQFYFMGWATTDELQNHLIKRMEKMKAPS